jgi:hypothetical protein
MDVEFQVENKLMALLTMTANNYWKCFVLYVDFIDDSPLLRKSNVQVLKS